MKSINSIFAGLMLGIFVLTALPVPGHAQVSCRTEKTKCSKAIKKANALAKKRQKAGDKVDDYYTSFDQIDIKLNSCLESVQRVQESIELSSIDAIEACDEGDRIKNAIIRYVDISTRKFTPSIYCPEAAGFLKTQLRSLGADILRSVVAAVATAIQDILNNITGPCGLINVCGPIDAVRAAANCPGPGLDDKALQLFRGQCGDADCRNEINLCKQTQSQVQEAKKRQKQNACRLVNSKTRAIGRLAVKRNKCYQKAITSRRKLESKIREQFRNLSERATAAGVEQLRQAAVTACATYDSPVCNGFHAEITDVPVPNYPPALPTPIATPQPVTSCG